MQAVIFVETVQVVVQIMQRVTPMVCAQIAVLLCCYTKQMKAGGSTVVINAFLNAVINIVVSLCRRIGLISGFILILVVHGFGSQLALIRIIFRVLNK